MKTVLYRTARMPALETLENYRAGAWIHVVEPTAEELRRLSEDFNLEVDLLDDSIDPYESPRIERENDAVYVFTRYCHPTASGNATEPLLVIYHPAYLITVMRSNTPALNRLLTGLVPVITTQKTKTLLQILEEANASYRRHLNTVTRQLLGIRSRLRRTDVTNEMLLSFIDIEDDLNEFLSALQPQSAMLRNLLNGRFMRLYEEDKDLVEDLSLGTGELIDLVKSRLKTIVNIRQAYDAIAAYELNRIFKRLTSISIFLMIPTLISGLYGMNVLLPLQEQRLAFWEVIGFMVLVMSTTFYIFRKKRWI